MHSVEIIEIYSHFFDKTSVKATFLLKKLLKSWFHEIFFGESEFLVFPHCVMQSLSKLETHSVEISEFFSQSYFTWNQLWRIYIEALELPFFPSFGFCFKPSKSVKITKNEKFKTSFKNVQKWQNLRLQICNCKLWFHVKSGWYKNSVISTLHWWCCLSKPILCSKSVMIEMLDLIPYKNSQNVQ